MNVGRGNAVVPGRNTVLYCALCERELPLDPLVDNFQVEMYKQNFLSESFFGAHLHVCHLFAARGLCDEPFLWG